MNSSISFLLSRIAIIHFFSPRICQVFEAISSKNWGASSTLMNEIAADSCDYEKYGIMMPIIWGCFDDTSGKSWKQLFKVCRQYFLW